MNTRTTQPDRSTPVTDIKPAAVERIHLPMQPHQQALHTLAAVGQCIVARLERVLVDEAATR